MSLVIPWQLNAGKGRSELLPDEGEAAVAEDDDASASARPSGTVKDMLQAKMCKTLARVLQMTDLPPVAEGKAHMGAGRVGPAGPCCFKCRPGLLLSCDMVGRLVPCRILPSCMCLALTGLLRAARLRPCGPRAATAHGGTTPCMQVMAGCQRPSSTWSRRFARQRSN